MEANPYKAPGAELLHNDQTEVVYAGFWIRVVASIIDTLLIIAITLPILFGIYGSEYFLQEAFIVGIWDFLINYIFPAIAVIVFWIYRSATPGKMAMGLKIIDATSHGKPSTGQLIGRYAGYYVSIIPLMLGIIWVAFDARKQGWHDKLAGTLVVKGHG